MPSARSSIFRPVALDPTKPMAATSGWPASSSPTTLPGPVTRLKTPGGRSASAMHEARTVAQTEVEDAGFQTTVFPAPRAGAMISAGIVYGQFQGVMTPTTPSGTR